jgi:putative ABC transport system permease protein
MAKFKVAVRVLAYFTLATGLMILIAASATVRSERTREVLLLRTLGASSMTLRRIVTTEAVALGVLASSVGAVLALAASWGLVRFVFELPFDPPLSRLAILAAVTLVISSLLGGASGRLLRASSPLEALRVEDSSGSGAG